MEGEAPASLARRAAPMRSSARSPPRGIAMFGNLRSALNNVAGMLEPYGDGMKAYEARRTHRPRRLGAQCRSSR